LSSAKDAKSSSSKGGKDAIVANGIVPQFSLMVAGRCIQVAGAREDSAYALFGMQGRVLKMGRAGSENFNLIALRAGTFLVRIGTEFRTLNIR